MTEHDLEQLSITTVRTLAIDAVQAANSGHPGMPMGCAPMAYVLFREAMRHDPTAPNWFDRDRFVLSAGHGSMLLYAYLHLTGYERPTLEDIQNFRQWGYPTAGHPESHELAGVETTTGPLGQGFANGVGMALAERRLAAEFNRPGHEIIDHRVYGIVSDGDLMEGVASEAASLAGHLKLGKIVYLYDDNHITIDGATDIAFSEDVLARFEAYGWHTERVADGNDVEGIRAAVKRAESDERPSLIAVRTVIGYGSPNKAGTSSSHGSPLGEEEIRATKEFYGWDPDATFLVPDEVRSHLDRRDAGAEERKAWQARLVAYGDEHPELAAELKRRIAGQLPDGWQESLPVLDGKDATRKHSGAVINAIADTLPELFGGSADLAGSNNTDVKDGRDFSASYPAGRNVRFGVREHAMASMSNGMALHGGLIPYAATFLVFTDYARPAMRLAALMGQRVVYVMTHDSVGLGEDGPTHQPVEHVASLRAMPNMAVWRPADGMETVIAWTAAIERTDGPTTIALTRQGLPYLGDRDAADVARGGYVLSDSADTPDVILVGTGSEVSLCVEAAEALAADGIGVRVVSMPCWEAFLEQDDDYRETVLPGDVTARVAVEAGTSFGWDRFVGAGGGFVTIDRFGASAPAERVFDELGFNVDNVVQTAKDLLGA